MRNTSQRRPRNPDEIIPQHIWFSAPIRSSGVSACLSLLAVGLWFSRFMDAHNDHFGDCDVHVGALFTAKDDLERVIVPENGFHPRKRMNHDAKVVHSKTQS